MGLLDWLFGTDDAGDDYGDSWRTYQERADHLREVYGWTLPAPPPPGGGHWMEPGRYDDSGGGWSW